MLSFFQTIVEFFQMIWDLITNVITAIGYAVTFLVGGLASFNILWPLMPAVIGGCVIASVAILVARFLLFK